MADIEDKIGGKAKELYTSTISTAASTIGAPPFLNKKTETRSPESPPEPPRQRRPLKPPVKATQVTQGPSIAERVARKSDPQYASQVAAAVNRNNPYVSNESKTALPQESRAINWDDVMIKKTRTAMRANGGAAAPSDNPATQTGSPVMQQPPPITTDFTSTEVNRPPANQAPSEGTPKRAFPASNQPSAPIRRTGPMKPTEPVGRDDEDSMSWKERISGMIPSLPRFHFRKSSSLGDFSSTIDAWKADEKTIQSPRRGVLGVFSPRKAIDDPPSLRATKVKDESTPFDKLPTSLRSLEQKCDPNRVFPLLTDEDMRACRSIGRTRSFYDVATLLFFLLGVRALPPFILLLSGGQTATAYLQTCIEYFADFLESWAPFALAAALLSALTNALVFERRVKSLAVERMHSITDEVHYGSLFLRLLTSEVTPTSTIEKVGTALEQQIFGKIQIVRLRNFVMSALLTLAFIAISFIQPVVHAVGSASLQILSLKEIRQWPPQWGALWESLNVSTEPIFQMISLTLKDGIQSIKDNPLRFAYEASLVLSLFFVSVLPSIEAKRKGQPTKTEEDEEELMAENYKSFTGQVSALGTSSSTRLALLSNSVEGMLERWRLARPPDADVRHSFNLHSFLKLCGYCLLSSVLLMLPVLTHAQLGIVPLLSQNQIIRWDSLFELAVVLYFVQDIVWKAITDVIKAKDAELVISGFLKSFRNALDERKKQLDSPGMSLQVQASISPVVGLAVSDLWAAHATRRAWAVRGANLECRSGEVLLILGDDSSGKSRLLTTIAETILSPPRASRTITRINRGSVAFGGLDVSKWDGPALRKRIGLVLNDIRMASNKAQIFSGLTMEEILEPFDGLRSFDPSHSPTPTERACITQALHITGLNASLLPRLPSKMATVVTANEEDLRPSHFGARASVLSPVDWSKVLLARVLSQTIFDNDSSSHTGGNFDNCLMGSLLLLDDVTSGLSEIDEARLLKNLRQTGAAVVVSSNHWTAGRWADKIVVLRDGAVVESGTHGELLTRGAQSLYASNWHAMTSMT